MQRGRLGVSCGPHCSTRDSASPLPDAEGQAGEKQTLRMSKPLRSGSPRAAGGPAIARHSGARTLPDTPGVPGDSVSVT